VGLQRAPRIGQVLQLGTDSEFYNLHLLFALNFCLLIIQCLNASLTIVAFSHVPQSKSIVFTNSTGGVIWEKGWDGPAVSYLTMDAEGRVYGYDASDKAVIEVIDDQPDGDGFRVLSDPTSTEGPAPVPAPASPAPTVGATTGSAAKSGLSIAEMCGIGIGALSGFIALCALLFEVYKHYDKGHS
jgi:hypothetical protein